MEPRAAKVISEWQERAYGTLGEDLGLGWNPRQAYEQLSSPPHIDDWRLSVDRLKYIYGPDYHSNDEWKAIEASWAEYMQRYYKAPETPYQDWNTYSNALASRDLLVEVIELAMPGRLKTHPLIATLPTGELNAVTRKVRGTSDLVILLQQGLIGFLYHFSNVVACIIPTEWIDPQHRTRSLGAGRPGDARHLEVASRYLTALIDAYIVRGETHSIPDPYFRGSTFFNQSFLAGVMRQFPICHELMHVIYGHVGEDKASLSRAEFWDREFSADLGSATIVSGAAEARISGSLTAATWACNAALAGFEMIERSVAYLRTGSMEVAERDTHPPHGLRREELIVTLYHRHNQDGQTQYAASLLELTNRGEDAIADLFSRAAAPHLEYLRRREVLPSPIWRPRPVPE